MTSTTVADIAAALHASVDGDSSLPIERPCHPAQARGARDLALAMAPDLVTHLAESPAIAAVVREEVDRKQLGLDAVIVVGEPRVALAEITKRFDLGLAVPVGVHPSAAIDSGAEVDSSTSIGPFVNIDDGARVGADVRIAAGVSIGAGAVIGRGTAISPGVRIGERVWVGERVRLHANVCLGSDGFSFIPVGGNRVQEAKAGKVSHGGSEGTIKRIHSLGSVVIGNDVEIGAGTAIDRGTIADTVIGEGTKIDNLVHIAHNVQIGRHCLICGQVGLAGSAEIGDRSILGGQVGVGDHVVIGADCLIGGKSLIGRRVPAGSVLVGWASLPRDEFHSVFRAIRRLARGQPANPSADE